MIYLDHAAATPLNAQVMEAMIPYYAEDFFNPSAAYLPAKKVATDYEMAKSTIANAIGAKAFDLIMTAGATEANNLAFTCLGVSKTKGNHLMPKLDNNRLNARVLYLVTEHDSIRRVAEKNGGIEVKVLENGLIDLNDLKNKITDETELVSVALVNNELGTIQPMTEISSIIREIKLDRMRRGIRRQLLLHSDASQALSLMSINVARLGIDLLTLNAAKIYGPKGVGALYVSREVKLTPLLVGGGQEKGLRSGTENVPGVIGFAKAVQLSKDHLNGNRKKYALWRKILLSELHSYELINKKHSLDSFVLVCYNGLDAERLIYRLEDAGVYVATGAACAASKGIRSHVLAAIGLSDSQIAGSLRITLGETNDENQLHEVAKIINDVVSSEYDRIDCIR